MGRPATISYDDFCAVAAELLAAPGDRPPKQRLSFKAVRDMLGGGSYDVLRRYIDQYLRELETGAAPAGVSSTLQALAKQAREEALREARAELADDAQVLAEDRLAFEGERETMRVALVTAQTQITMLERRVSEVLDERAELHTRLDAERQRRVELQERLARLEGALQAEKEAHAVAVANAAQERAALVDRHAADLQAALGRFEAVQQHALRQVEDLRTQHIGKVEQLLDARLTSSTQQLLSIAKTLQQMPTRLVDQAQAKALLAQSIDSVASRIETSMDQIIDQVCVHVDQALLKMSGAGHTVAAQGSRPRRAAPPAAKPSSTRGKNR